MPKIKIPEDLRKYFMDQAQGIDKLPDFLKLDPQLQPVLIISSKTLTYPRFTFQGGTKRTIEIPATAGTTVYNSSPTEGFRWLLTRGYIILVADANAANRYINCELTDGTNVTGVIGLNSTAITAGLTKGVAFGQMRLPDEDWVYNDRLARVSYSGIAPTLLEGADALKITVGGGLAGDSYSGNLTVLEVEL